MSHTQGPRMNPARTREILDKLDIEVVRAAVGDARAWRQLNDYVVCIRRRAPEPELWDLRTGGGIVANADQVWLTPTLYREPPGPYEARGPFWNKTQLERALRAWKRGG